MGGWEMRGLTAHWCERSGGRVGGWYVSGRVVSSCVAWGDGGGTSQCVAGRELEGFPRVLLGGR